MGVPLTLVLTPLLYVVTMVVAEIVNYFSPLPPEFFRNADLLAGLGLRVGDFVINQRGRLDPQELALGLALLLLPGMIVTFLLWTGMLMLFRRGGVGGMLATLNARVPNQGDLKELRLADVAQEMAVAAGLPCPQVMLIDSPGANAAAIGTSAHDARIVLSRRLLDDLDRDQLQAVIAHLVGSIGNGDLAIAFTVTSIFETCGLLVNMINVPFSKASRHRLWRIVRYIFSRAPADTLAARGQVWGVATPACGGGGWAPLLFVQSRKGGGGFRGTPPPAHKKLKPAPACRGGDRGGAPAVNTQTAASADEFIRMRAGIMSTAKAAMTGDARAIQRMAAFAQIMGGDPALSLHAMPNLADLTAARQGDSAEHERIRALVQTHRQEEQSTRGQSGLQMESIISFHPQLKRPAKRLQKMGAPMVTPGRYRLRTQH